MSDLNLVQILNSILDIHNPAYHAPKVTWNMEWLGYTWEDMVGWDEEDQKLAFALFRRGLDV